MRRRSSLVPFDIVRKGDSRSFWAKVLLIAAFGLSVFGFATTEQAAAASEGAVYVVPVKQTVESGLASFIDRALTEAEEAKASLVVLDVNTPGGELRTAEEIGTRIRTAKVPTVAYVTGKAASAGAYLTLNAGGIAMAPGTSIGAAMIVDANGQPIENPKYVSFWTSEMVAAAQLNGRNPDIAVGMVDPGRVVELKELGRTKDKGQIITLSAQDALKVGYADKLASSVEEVLAWKGLSDRTVVEFNPSFSERLAEFVTGSGVSTILLILGIAGIAIEMLVPGFGAPGIVGLLSFGLYFFGHAIAGFAGMESIVFFVLGIAFLVFEMFVPSFGILGLLGCAGVVAGIAMAANDTGDAVRSLGWAVLAAAVIVAVFAYIFRRKGIWNKFILRERLSTEGGYVPNEPRESWLGQEGIALTTLRPAGIAEISGSRVDVVTSGEYVDRGTPIIVTAIDGTRIVVKERK
ncbi:nodulation protein NfeD [Cohnella faecalis]|uniref:Nodulation protein NfeD n=1 Tax=Cohnella faecalis TaxID=2315694 RepID=A0A398CPU0_9BACL|nr:nodulation protein NfeD [Cohnella faecalis]